MTTEYDDNVATAWAEAKRQAHLAIDGERIDDAHRYVNELAELGRQLDAMGAVER